MQSTTVTTPDIKLVNALKNRDQEAFSHLYDKYAPMLYGIIVKSVKDEQIAVEILKDSFLKFWNECNNVEQNCRSLFPWLYTTTCKTALQNYQVQLTLKVPLSS